MKQKTETRPEPAQSQSGHKGTSFNNRSARPRTLETLFDELARKITRLAGSPVAFGLAVCGVIVWAASGPLFDFSETWQLIINTSTTIVTFLMVFLIQQNQNKDSKALHVKLDELLFSVREADDCLMNIEASDEQTLREIEAYYSDLAQKARDRLENTQS